MKSRYIHSILAIGLMMTASVALCAGAGQIASLKSDDVDNASFSLTPEGYITIMFSARPTFPKYAAGTLVAEGGSFSGDFVAAGVEKVGFRIRSESTVTVPVSACVILKGTSGRTWRNTRMAVSNVGGQWVANNIGFDLADGWSRSGGGDKAVMWAEDIGSVEYVGLRFNQKGKEAQSYSVDTFTLIDAGGNIVGESGLLPPRVMDYFQVTYGVSDMNQVTDEMKNTDSDGDGMSDWEELLVGTDPEDRNSVFVAKIVDYKDDGITVSWPCVSDGVYEVMKRDGFLTDFSVISVGLVPGSTENASGVMTFKDTFAPGRGPYMYKVIKK